MRVTIKTKTPVKDNDIKALLLIEEAMRLSSPHMKSHNLSFIAKRYNMLVLRSSYTQPEV
jgi:hypothetical protein